MPRREAEMRVIINESVVYEIYGNCGSIIVNITIISPPQHAHTLREEERKRDIGRERDRDSEEGRERQTEKSFLL